MAQLDFRQLDHAVVYKGDVEAGVLDRGDNMVVFRYRTGYPASAGPVARTLPVAEAPFVERGGAVPAFFAGLLPEGRRLIAMRSRLKTSADDEFTQLVSVGADCIGDVRVLAPDASPPATVDVSRTPDSFRELFSELLERPLDDAAIPGVQDKVSDSIISVPAAARWGPTIVKLSPSAFPRIVENEAFFLNLASRCGLEVPRITVIHDRSGESALLTQRFDRISRGGSSIVRIAQEDAIQLMGRWPEAKYRVSTREVFATVAKNASAPLPELQKLTRLFAFSYIIGNGDLHGKNVSLYRVDGLWKLTPAYDLLSTLPYGDRTMALDLEGRNDNIRQRDLIAVAGREGLNEKAARRAILEVCATCETAIVRLGEIGLADKSTHDLERVMAKRIADLRG